MKALILTNGDYGDYQFCKDLQDYQLVVCADNGMKHGRILGIVPDVIIGDFDSCNEDDLAYFASKNVEIIRVASEKDETDTELAIQLAVERGSKFVDVYGGTGSRIDHSMANVQLLYRYLQKEVSIVLYSGKNTVTLVKDSIKLEGKPNDLVSLMPFTESVRGVVTHGLAYPLVDGTFKLGDAFGVSNYMIGCTGSIEVKEGVLMVVLARD